MIKGILTAWPHKSVFARALNGGRALWTPGDHLLADLWMLTLRAHVQNPSIDDHPVRAAMEADAKAAAKADRMAEIKATFEQRKQLYAKNSGGDE